MAKAVSPIRIQDELMQQAIITGKRYHRSAAQQIEYWADIGRQLSSQIDPDKLMALSMGLAELSVKTVSSQTINPKQVFDKLEQKRATGKLKDEVTESKLRYQISENHPGYLELIDEQGNRQLGQFCHGEFVAKKG